jgi:hypothetical protein
MTVPATFGGGQIEMRTLLEALAGRPLQARLEERFTPADGGPVQERMGRVQISSQRLVRFDVLEGAGPPVAFVHDLATGRIGGGLSDQPSTWFWAPGASGRPPTCLSPPQACQVPGA